MNDLKTPPKGLQDRCPNRPEGLMLSF